MKAASNNNEPSRDDAVTRELLLLADGQEIEPPRDVLDRVRAKLHENTVRSSPASPARDDEARVAQEGLVRRGRCGGSGADRMLFWMQPSTTAWSQVVQTVRAMPWIHAKAVAGDGTIAGIVGFVFPKHRRHPRRRYGSL